MQENQLNLTNKDIENYLEIGKAINKLYSCFKPGELKDKNNYEATFAKKCYYNDAVIFYIDLFVSHHKVHAFHDGNKRTALNFLKINIEHIHEVDGGYEELMLHNLDYIAICQVMFLEKEIDEINLKETVYNCISFKMIDD